MKRIILILTLLLAFTGCSSSNEEPTESEDVDMIAISEAFANDLTAGNYSELVENYDYTTDMKKAVSEQLYSDLISQLTAGDFISINEYEESEVQGYPQVTVTFEYTDVIFKLNLVFDKNDASLIAGINVADHKKKQ